MLVIGAPRADPCARHALAWEMAESLYRASDGTFMHVTQEAGEELYRESWKRAELVAKKMGDNIVDQYILQYSNRVSVAGNSVGKFLGHYSLTTTVHPFSAGILLLENGVLCVAGGDNKPCYVFDAASGTLERTDNIYSTLQQYVPDGAALTAYIVSREAMPIVIELREEIPKEEPHKVLKEEPPKGKGPKEEREEEPPKEVPPEKRPREEEVPQEAPSSPKKQKGEDPPAERPRKYHRKRLAEIAKE